MIDKIKAIRERYGYPIWLTKEALNYYDGDIDKATKKLNEIYRAIGDHPDVVVKRNIENFMNEVRSKNLMCKDNSARSVIVQRRGGGMTNEEILEIARERLGYSDDTDEEDLDWLF